MMRWALRAALLGTMLGLWVFWIEPGPLSIDEVTYHRMTRDLVGGNGLFIENGYEEMRSAELASPFIRSTSDGRLAAQYPYGYSFVAAPFYALFGVKGMFLLNALAFVFAVLLIERIARQVGCDRRTAVVAAALLVVSFFSEYALALWPHASAVAALLGAMTCAIASYQDATRRALWFAFAAGGCTGLATMLRLDSLFCIPALVLPFVFAAPVKWRQVLALLVGVAPGLAAIVATNYVRWHALSPVTYGPKAPQVELFVAFGVAALALVAGVWLVTRARSRAWLARHARPVALAVCLAALVVLLFPPVQGVAARVARGLVAIVLDLRVRPPDLTSTIGTDAVIFIDGFKRSLLQSTPFLAIASLCVFPRWRARLQMRWIALVPTIWIGFYGAFAWHGGLSMNMRYLLPTLPFLCIVVANILCVAAAEVGRLVKWLALASAIALFVGYFALLPGTFEAREPFVLTTPLVLVALIAIAAAVWRGRACAWPFVVVAACSIGWSAAATVHDAIWSHDRRALHHRIATHVSKYLTDDALLLAEFPDPFYAVIEDHDRVTIAVPFYDRGDSAGALIRDAHTRGRAVFAVLLPPTWRTLEEAGALDGLDIRQLGQVAHYSITELRPRR